MPLADLKQSIRWVLLDAVSGVLGGVGTWPLRVEVVAEYEQGRVLQG